MAAATSDVHVATAETPCAPHPIVASVSSSSSAVFADIDPRVTNAALEFVTKKVFVVADGGTQAFGESDFTKLDTMKLGSNNRNVNAVWADDLAKTMFSELHTRRECTVLTLCIDTSQLKATLEDDEARASFRAIILDGQHRWTAMRAIRAAYPEVNIPFWVVVHLVSNDAEQQAIIERLERRSPITPEDLGVIDARTRFKNALVTLVGVGNLRKHAFIEAADHIVLREPRVCTALARLGPGIDAIRSALERVSIEYEPLYRECHKASLRGSQRAIIRDTRLFFFMADPREWVPRMLFAQDAPPLGFCFGHDSKPEAKKKVKREPKKSKEPKRKEPKEPKRPKEPKEPMEPMESKTRNRGRSRSQRQSQKKRTTSSAREESSADSDSDSGNGSDDGDYDPDV